MPLGVLWVTERENVSLSASVAPRDPGRRDHPVSPVAQK